MAKVFLVPIDFSKNEAQNMRFHNLASPPSAPAVGQVYYDTSDNAFYGWDGVSWVVLSLSAEQIEDIVAAMFSGGTHDGISVSYEDNDGTISLTIDTLDKLPAPTGSLSMNNQKITNLGSPTDGTDAATKAYVDSVANGLSWKDAVRVATTTAVDISTELEAGDTIDGVTLVAGDRVLVKDQDDQATPAPEENGIYVVQSTGPAVRASDADSGDELIGAAVFVSEGDSNGNSAWVMITDAPITVGTTALEWAQFGAGSAYSGGTGIQIVGNTINQRTYEATVGDGVSTSILVTHNLGSRDVKVQVYRNSDPWDEVECDVARNSTNAVTLGFSVAPSEDEYRVTIGF